LKIRIITEFIIIILLGGVPVMLSFFSGGTEALEETISSLLAQELAINYASFLTAFFFIVAFLEWYLYKPSIASRKAWALIRSIFSETGTAIISVFRIGSGVLISFPILWFIIEPESFKLANVSGFLFYGVLMFIECVFLSFAHQYVKKWEPKSF